MALKNTKLSKVGSAYSVPQTSGHSQAQVVVATTAAPNPGPNDGSASWVRRYQDYLESTTPTVKYSQDSE